MGIGPMRSDGSLRSGPTAAVLAEMAKLGNPDPNNFTILRTYNKGSDLTAALVHYPDAKNFEGKKLMILRMDDLEVRHAKHLDPHFSEGGPVVVRLAPTPYGWGVACDMIDGGLV